MARASRRGLVLGGVWLASTIGLISLAAIPGCYGRNCEGDIQFYGIKADQGHMIDENTWESNAFDKDWLPFPKQRLWVFDIPSFGGRTPKLIIPYISADPKPTGAQSFTVGGGNLAELYSARPNGIDVKNGTCADYYLRLVVITEPQPPVFTPSDGGVDQ